MIYWLEIRLKEIEQQLKSVIKTEVKITSRDFFSAQECIDAFDKLKSDGYEAKIFQKKWGPGWEGSEEINLEKLVAIAEGKISPNKPYGMRKIYPETNVYYGDDD